MTDSVFNRYQKVVINEELEKLKVDRNVRKPTANIADELIGNFFLYTIKDSLSVKKEDKVVSSMN